MSDQTIEARVLETLPENVQHWHYMVRRDELFLKADEVFHNLEVAYIEFRLAQRSMAFLFTPWLQPGDPRVLLMLGNRLNGFRFLGNLATWLKPGVNETAC